MSSRVLCPHEDDLRKLVSGDITLENLETLAEHLEACPSCLARVQKLSRVDPLVCALQNAGPIAAEPDGEFVSDLIGKLKSIFPSTETSGEQAGPHRSGDSDSDSASIGATLDDSLADDDDPIDFLTPAQEPDELGRLGPYRVFEVIARGGMGVVFRAEDPSLMRIVALKVIRPSLAASSTAKKRFFREARVAANIRHDHIVTIHQVGEDRGVPYLAMEYLHGESLESRLRRERKLTPGEAIRLGRQIAAGLSAAHVKGLIHRDIKPANIWLEAPAQGSTESRVKILDFGLARGANDAAGLTHAGAIIGTPAYMSPEQASGRDIDARADLFSLGSVLYTMTTGQPPFRAANSIATLMAICNSDAVAPRTLDGAVPQKLSDFILRLLAKSPAERPASADTVVSELAALASARGESQEIHVRRTPTQMHAPTDGTQPHSSRPSSLADSRRHRSRRLWSAIVGFTAIGICVALGMVFFLPTPHGTIRVEVNDNDIEVVLSKAGVKIQGSDARHEIAVAAGDHELKVKRGDLEFETKQFVLKKGETVTVKVDYLDGKLLAAADGQLIGERQAAVAVAPPMPTKSARFALRVDQVVPEDGPDLRVPKLKLPPTGPVTIEGFVNVLNPRDPGPNPQYFGGTYQFWLAPNGFYWEARTNDPSKPSERLEIIAPPLKPKAWVHFAFVRDSVEHRAYVDGVLVGRKSETRPLLTGDHVGSFFIGRLVNGFAFKEIRVSTSARYREHFTPQKRFDPDEQTLALFHLDEGEGDVAKDSSHNGNHVSLRGSFATWMNLDEPFELLRLPPNATWKPTVEQQRFLNDIERLPEREKVESVVGKLREINQVGGLPPLIPVFEPVNGAPTRCQIVERHVSQLWPLAALKSLRNIDVWETTVIDYAPLTRLSLVELKAPLIVDNVEGESALRSITTLRRFNDQPASKTWDDRAALRREIDQMTKTNAKRSFDVRMVWFADIMKRLHPNGATVFLANRAPDEGSFGLYSESGLTCLGCSEIGPNVFDLSPVRALGVDAVHLGEGRFFDLTPLAKVKLRRFTLHGNQAVRDLSPLAGSPLVHLDLRSSFVTDLRPLAGMKLESFEAKFTPLSDLTPLKGMPLRVLNLRETRVADLSPLADITTLKSLDIHRTRVFDLRPILRSQLDTAVLSPLISDLTILKGMPLTHLELEGPAIADLSPLKGMALKLLWCQNGRPTDLTPLKGMPIVDLHIDFEPARDAAVLRSLPSIMKINGRPAKDVLASLP